MRFPKSLITCLLVVLSIAACGSKTTTTTTPSVQHSPSAETHALLEQAIGQINASRVQLDGTITVNVTLPNTALTSFDSHPMNAAVHVTLNGFSNIRASLKGKAGSDNVDSGVIEVNGIIYVSGDGGKTWTKSSGLPGGLNAIELPLEYLFSVDQVTDEGPQTLNGKKVEMYQATLKSATLAMAVGTAIANVEPAYPRFAQAAGSASFAGSGLTLYTDRNGHIVQENGYVDISVPASSIQAGATGKVTLRVTVATTFSQYGSAPAPATAPPAA